MNRTVLCPACKRDVVFDVINAQSQCPQCGARFALEPEFRRRRWPRRAPGLIFALWLFAPTLLALITLVMMRVMTGTRSFDAVFGKYQPNALVWIWLALAAVSCYAACSWFAGRFTEKRALRVLIGVFLGGGILICNIIAAFLGGCVLFPISL